MPRSVPLKMTATEESSFVSILLHPFFCDVFSYVVVYTALAGVLHIWSIFSAGGRLLGKTDIFPVADIALTIFIVPRSHHRSVAA